MEGAIKESSLKTLPKEAIAFGSKLNKFFKEQEPGMPKVAVNIFSSPHGKPEDMKGVEDEIKKADIYIPELMGWEQKDLEGLREASEGKTPLKDLKKRFRGKVGVIDTIENVYGAQKAIVIIDAPKGHELVSESKKVNNYAPPIDKSFDDVIEYTRGYLIDSANHQTKREEFMLSQIKPKIKEILDLNPELKNRKKINILLSLGSAHSNAGDDYSKVGFEDEGVIKYKKGEFISRKEAAQIFIERACGDLLFNNIYGLGWLTQDAIERIMIQRKVFSEFGIEDAENILNEIKKYGTVTMQKIIDVINAKNIELPKSKDDIDKFLNT